MARVKFLSPEGQEFLIEGEIGKSLMQIALDNMVPGIIGDCGGCCSCATCHVYIDDGWRARLAPPSADESAMLEGSLDVRESSRLACQIPLREELDGIVLHVPAQL